MKNEYLEQTKKFYEIYNKEGYPVIKKYEPLQKKLFLKVIFYYSIFGVITLALLVFAIIQSKQTANPMYLYIIALCCYGLFNFVQKLVYKENWKYNNTLKSECMSKFLQIFGNISWDNAGKETNVFGSGLSPEIFKFSTSSTSEPFTDMEIFSYGLFPAYIRRRDDDFFSGTYKDVPFKIVETTLRGKPDGSKKEKTIFQGVLVLFQTPKKTNSTTVIKQKLHISLKQQIFRKLLLIVYVFLSGLYIIFFNLTLVCILLLFFGIPLAFCGFLMYLNNLKDSKSVKLESTDFNKKFNITSSDQVEARYLITPSFMERLLKLETAFNADTVNCSFRENSVMFALGTNKNLFELGSLYIKAENPKSIQNFYNEFSSIIKMIEYFKLDEHTGV